MKKHIDSEKDIEQRLADLVKLNGGLCLKLLSDHINGLPDRLCLFPGKKIYFVELKTTGQKPRKLQIFMHGILERLGFDVVVLDSIEKVNNFINDVMTL